VLRTRSLGVSETLRVSEGLDGTARAGKRGFRPAPCLSAGIVLAGGHFSCARARRRPARARSGLRL